MTYQIEIRYIMRLGVTDALAMFTETCTGDQYIERDKANSTELH